MSLARKIRKQRRKLLDFLFSHTLGRLPAYRRWSPDIEIVDSIPLIKSLLAEERARIEEREGRRPRVIDIGARRKERAWLAEGYEYHSMDIIPQAEDVVVGDICSCPEIADASYDVVMSFDVFEHVERPWDAALEAIRILRPGGLMIHRTLFAYRYHPSPIDYWRFSAQGLEYLFSRTGEMETLVSAYDLRIRREDKRGTSLRDRPPIDFLGGFRENWRTLYIGRKKEASASSRSS
jgi:SAM-dependent methyltransferase